MVDCTIYAEAGEEYLVAEKRNNGGETRRGGQNAEDGFGGG